MCGSVFKRALNVRWCVLFAVLTLISWSAHAPQHASAQDARGIAQNLYSEGIEHLDQQRYSQALAALRRSVELVSSPNTRLMIARTQVALNRLADAAYSYELTIAEARDLSARQPRYQPTVAAAEAELTTLSARLGRIRVVVLPRGISARVQLDGQEVPAGALGSALWARPGMRRVRVQASGHSSVEREVSIDVGGQHAVELVLVPSVSADEGPRRTPGLVLSIVGALAVGSAAVTLVMAGAQHAELRSQCDMGCSLELQPDVRRGQRLARTGYALSAIGGVALATGLTLIFLPGPQAPEQASLHWATHF